MAMAKEFIFVFRVPEFHFISFLVFYFMFRLSLSESFFFFFLLCFS